MLTLYFFPVFFLIVILKRILRNTNFDYRVISVGTQDQLQELIIIHFLLCIQLN